MKDYTRRLEALERTKPGEVLIIRIVEVDDDGQRVPMERFIVEPGQPVRAEAINEGRDDEQQA
jgi:hypothetical protein